MMPNMKLSDWFCYSDRDKPDYNPIIDHEVTIERFIRNKVNEFNSPDWRCEEWLIRSALVPVSQLNDAIQIESPDCITFEVGWNFEDKFSFGDHSQFNEIQLYPLSYLRKHPVSQECTVELSRDFITYHALQMRNQSQYFHPLENLLVAETHIETHEIGDPTARVIIYRDYLCDFLAEKGMGLLISVVADRFANSPTEDGLELEQFEDRKIDENTWISSIIHSSEFTGHGNFRGRSILHRNFIIEPYDKPKFERSPWPYFGKQTRQEGDFPSFIVNSEGMRKPLPDDTYLGNYISNDIGKYGYLYFRPEVLQKYLRIPGYKVFFHMRNWGIASLPGSGGKIDVGINSQGLINAFAPDIADLSASEQSYWASYSSLPSGEICEEMFQTRMQQNPPHSPGVTELIRGVRSQLNNAFKDKISVELFSDIEPRKQDLCVLSVGPIGREFTEVFELAKILYGWLIEPMRIEVLRTVLIALGENVDKNLRQIKLLEKILLASGLEQKYSRAMTAPLIGLNDLRIGSAHIGSIDLEAISHLMGVKSMPTTPREMWNIVFDAVIKSLHSINDALTTSMGRRKGDCESL
ncbi:MAG: hypothetical protein R3B95_10620 [Nitrospirales bacterium]|nr:hypothetical protein [Nitrospirales bacterium]